MSKIIIYILNRKIKSENEKKKASPKETKSAKHRRK